MKSITTTPPMLRSLSWRAISTAASQLVHNTVSRALADRVNEPELTSMTVSASVGSMITYPPEGSSTRGLRASRMAVLTR